MEQDQSPPRTDHVHGDVPLRILKTDISFKAEAKNDYLRRRSFSALFLSLRF